MPERPTRSLASAAALAASIAICFAIAAVGARFSPGAWYASLGKPPLNPPNWIFAPVWSALYLMMAVAAWLVWRRRPGVGRPLSLFGLQLLLNASWSWLFFGLHRTAWALADIALLWIVLLLTIRSFRRFSQAAAALLVPYVAWVTFAAYLNFGLWYLNRP